MTTEMSKLLDIAGKQNLSPDDIVFIETTFSRKFLKKKNQIKRAVKIAKGSIYGW